MKKILLSLFIVASSINIFAKDIQELVVTTNPPMSCQNCENKIKGNIRFEKGVKNIETNIPDQRVTVTYDAEKTNPEKIEKAFDKIGYHVTVIDENGKTVCPESGNENACCEQNGTCCQQKEACCN